MAIRAIVSDSNAPPYALFDANDNLVGGISKDILDGLASRSKLPLHYLPLPRGRVEQWLQRDEADIACFLNPAWVEQPGKLYWSKALFSTQQLLVRRSTSPRIQRLDDLLGKRIGTDRGFSYPELEPLFAQRLAVRDDASSLQNNLSRLTQQRVDVVMTVDLAYHYHLQQFGSNGLQADPLWSQPTGVYCAISPHQPELARRLQAELQLMVQDGSIEQLLQHYKPAQTN